MPEGAPRVEAMLKFMTERNKDLVSAGVRRADGTLVAASGEHAASWKPLVNDHSTDRQLQVPILAKGERWGQLELAFGPTGVPHLFGMEVPWLYLAGFMLFSCFGSFYFYLGRMLRHLDVSHAVPARVRSALDTLAEGLLVIDKKENIVLANQAFAMLTGAAPEVLVARQVSELGWLGPDGAPLAKDQCPWAAALREGAVQRDSILHFTDSAGKVHTFSANCSPVMGPDGNTGGVLISLDDVTELEQNKAELRVAKDEADAANRAKSDFLANMSHEIRTPMNAILGFTEVLKRGWGRNEREARRHLDTIHSSGKHLIELINDILDLSKVEAGRMEVERIDCAPHETIREVVRVLDARAREKGVTLEFEAAGAASRAHPVRSRPPPADRHQPRRQRAQVHRARRRARRRADAGHARRPAARDRRHRHRRRHSRGQGRQALPGVRAGRHLGHAEIRRHGARSRPQPELRPRARRRHHRDERARQRQYVHRHDRHRCARSACGCSIRPRRRGWTEDVAAGADIRWEFPAKRILVVDDGPENRELVSPRARRGRAHHRRGGERPDRGRHGRAHRLRRDPHGYVDAGDGRPDRNPAPARPRARDCRSSPSPRMR